MENKKHTPEIRFSGFTEDWEQHKVGDFYFFKNGLNKEKEYFGTGTPIVNFTDVFHNRGLLSKDLKGKVQLTQKEINNYEVQQGDIFFTRTSETIEEIGYPSVMIDNPSNTVFSGFVLRGRAMENDPLVLDYKRYVFFTNTFREEMKKKSTMSTRALTSGTAIKEMVFKYPKSKVEQERIGKFIKQIDDMITLLELELTTLKKTKQGFLQKMFPKEGEYVPEIRFPGFTGDWEQCKLKNIIDLLKDGTHGTHKDGTDAFLLSAKNIKNGQIIIDELTDRKISSEDYNSIFRNYKLRDQDLLITIVGTIGQTALYKETISKLAFQRSVAIVRGNKDMNQHFLKSTVDSNYVQKQLKQSASMSAQAGVYLGDLEKLTLYIPELSEQTEIGNFFKQFDETIALYQRELDALKETKKAFLQKMFV